MEHGYSVFPLAAFFCCFCMAVPLVHVVSVVCHQGHAPAVGAGVLFTMMAAGAVGRIAIGLLADRFGALPAYMLASVIQTATVFWFVATPEMAIIIPLAVVFGFGFAGNMTSLILAVREAVPASHVGRSTGIVGMIAWLGMGAGGYVSGWLYDVTGSHAASFALAAAAGAANLVTLVVLAHQERPARGVARAGRATCQRRDKVYQPRRRATGGT